MKNFLPFFLFTVLFFCCQNTDPIPLCENGRYDEGEVAIDCGGTCPDCIFDKNDLLDKTWKDVESDLLPLDSTFIREHYYRGDDHRFFANWENADSGGVVINFTLKYWEWVNGSDTIQFEFNDTVFPKRKILYVGKDFYKFKTDRDGWEYVYPAVLEE